ncbi:MAG: hypothetical protein R2941_06485 [Desulfobacterales bacterium]
MEILKRPELDPGWVFEMTRNPLLLTNICLVHLSRGNLPTMRAALYDECTDVLLERWREPGIETKVASPDRQAGAATVLARIRKTVAPRQQPMNLRWSWMRF